MKKILFIVLLIIIFTLNNNAYAVENSNTDYNTFSEIIMSKGKLLKNFTDEEFMEYESHLPISRKNGYFIYEVNHLVNATYISNTLYSIENKGNSDIVYNLKIKVEKNNKLSFTATCNTSASSKGDLFKFKHVIEAELGVEFSEVNTRSELKEEELELIVEAQSRAIVYLAGNLTISNGIVGYYFMGLLVGVVSYEVVTIMNQYVRIEKASL